LRPFGNESATIAKIPSFSGKNRLTALLPVGYYRPCRLGFRRHKEKTMTKQYRILFFIIGIVVLTGFVSCLSSGKPVKVVPDEVAEQIALIKLYVPGPDENVKTLDIFLEQRKWFRKDGPDIIADLNYYKKGVWYNEHQDKIVSVKLIYKNQFMGGRYYLWRIEYVD
jgi:hypothetical protein